MFRGKKQPKKIDAEGEKPAYCLDPRVIVTGDLKGAVKLPQDEQVNEWVANTTLSFFHHINLYYGIVTEYCTPQTCPTMVAKGAEYLYTDDRGKKIKSSASAYIDYAMTHIEGILDDDMIFPTSFSVPFPRDFLEHVRRIFKMLFHILAHLYHSHYDQYDRLSTSSELNTLFIHFYFFAKEFDLLDEKDFVPLADLAEALQAALEKPREREESSTTQTN